MGQKHRRFWEFRTPFPLRDIQAIAQFVLKIEELSHVIGTAPILEMVRVYSLHPRLWLLPIFGLANKHFRFIFQADILVGTAASNLNLTQNPCARALSQAAGPSLQQECTNIGHVAVGDIAVISQPGNLQCKAVIFAICSQWDNGKGKKVKSNYYDLLVVCSPAYFI